MASVNLSQPILLWLAGSWARTVSIEFRSSTPCRAQGSKSVEPLVNTPKSELNSLKIFLREGGAFTPMGTLNDSPQAWPSP